MNKTFLIASLLLISFTLSVTCEVVELTDDNFASSIKEGNWLVKFFAPWCGHCKRLAPTWEELGKEDTSGVKIAKVDCTIHKNACSSQEIRGYPTLLYFSNGAAGEKYSGARELAAFKTFIAGKTGKAAPAAPAAAAPAAAAPAAAAGDENSKVVVLGADNFDSTIAGKDFYVKFYAPWCGHCKKMIPQWNELANVEGINVGKVDCTIHKDLATKYEIRGFPTIILFKANGEQVKYQGAREVKAFTDFWNANTKA